MPDAKYTAWRGGPVGILGRTGSALRVAGGRWDSRLVFVVAALAYFVLYLGTVGDLSLVGGSADGLTVRTADDLSRAFASLGFFRFDAVAVVGLAGMTFLVSPLNMLVAAVLALLVAANLSLTYLGLIQPRACGLEASTGVIAGIPALLSGAACCGPTILLVLGIQASATLVTGFQLLLPLAVTMLVGSLLLIGRQVDPALVETRGASHSG